jgi:RecA/RadA recombinase
MGRPRKNSENEASEVNEETGEVKSLKSVLDINSIVSKVQSSFGKDKGRAGEICKGSEIVYPTRDDEFVCWKNSPWQELTSIKGVPFGKVVQIAGQPDSGKSTHAMQFMKNAQDQGGIVIILWDSENKFSARRFSENFGGNPDQLIEITSKMILEGGDTVERTIHKVKEAAPDAKILLVWDSVGGTLAANEDVEINKDGSLEGGLDQGKQLAAAAKENGQVLRAFIRLMEKYKDREKGEETIAILLINQTYANIGSVGQKQSGGQKVEFYSSLILQLTRKGNIEWTRDGNKRKVGIISRARVVKNHLFDGLECIAEMELAIVAGGIQAAGEFDIEAYKKFVIEQEKLGKKMLPDEA